MQRKGVSHKRIINSFNRLDSDPEWSFKDVTRSGTMAYTHSYHRYPAKFIPNIVEKLLKDYTSKFDIVLDPFGGCGTTMVESKRLGRKSIGLDINPIAKFIAEVKITPIDPDELEEEFEKLSEKISELPGIELNYHLKNDRINYWFSKKSIKKLDHIYITIKRIKHERTRRFFLCAFSHILKNASKWLMKSIKPTIDKSKVILPIESTFLRHTRSMVNRNKKFYEALQFENRLKISAKVKLADATKKLPVNKESVDIIITSPPYVTSYEYADLHELSLLWFGADKNEFQDWNSHSRNFPEFRRKFIGTSFKSKQTGEMTSVIGEKIVAEITKIDKGLSKDVANYFIDMRSAFGEMYRVLKPNKYACVIIGNTQLKGVNILNAEVATEQMLNIGFKQHKLIKREVPNKMITPWRDTTTGKFTSVDNPNKKCAYEYEYVLIMKK